MRGRLKRTIYARMEEMSFRSGAAVSAGVLAAAGVAITLAVVPGGPSPKLPGAPAPSVPATSAPGPGAAARSAAPPSWAPASTSPSARPSLRPAVPAPSGQPPSPVAVVTPQASPAPAAAGLATPRRLDLPEAGEPGLWDASWGWDPSWGWRHRELSDRHGDAAPGLRGERE